PLPLPGPRSVVWLGGHRAARAWVLPGALEGGPAAITDERPRLRDDVGRVHRRAQRARHLACSYPSQISSRQRQAREPLVAGRRAAAGDARGRGQPLARSTQSGYPGVDHPGIPPHGAPRDRRHAARAISGRPQRRARVSGKRSAARGLPHRGQAAPAPLRWHRQPPRRALRDPLPLSASLGPSSALRPLGLEPRRSDRSALRGHPLPGASDRQGCQRRKLAPRARACQRRASASSHGHRPAPEANDRRLRRHGSAAGLPPQLHLTGGSRMNPKLLALYGLKFDPFSPEVPTEALFRSPKIENFCWRIEQAHLREGGFALIHGDPGSGKSVVMRVLAERLARLADLSVGVVHHPQSNLSDFYRELGDIFGVSIRVSNRWGGFKALRTRWLDHLGSTTRRSVLLCDEAQEMSPLVLNELRLLSSARFDSQSLLCIVLAGDARLLEKLRREELIPL